MAWFHRKPANADIVQAVVALAHDELARRGVETLMESGDDIMNPTLRASGVSAYPLGNLIERCRLEPRRRWRPIVQRHVAIILSSAEDPDAADLSPAELRRQLRTRLMPDLGDSDLIDLRYARPFAPGLVVALSIDYPDTVRTLGAHEVERLSLGIDEAYAIGQANSDAEPIDERQTLAPGITLLLGKSLFVATKVTNMEHLIRTTIGPAPNGIVFAMPHREMVAYVKPDHARSIEAVARLVGLVGGIARGEVGSLPGGLLTPGVYYWVDGDIEQIAGRPGAGPDSIDATGLFGAALGRIQG